MTSGRLRSSTDRDFMSSGKWERAASLSSTVLKCATLLEAPHFSILVIFALSSSLKRSLTASSVETFMINRPSIGSAGFDVGDEGSVPFAAVPFVAAVAAFSFSLLTGPGWLATLVWAGWGVAGFGTGAGAGAGDSDGRGGPVYPRGCCWGCEFCGRCWPWLNGCWAG